jgi:hypothetical protein
MEGGGGKRTLRVLNTHLQGEVVRNPDLGHVQGQEVVGGGLGQVEDQGLREIPELCVTGSSGKGASGIWWGQAGG